MFTANLLYCEWNGYYYFQKHNSLKEIDEGETMQIFNAYKVFVSKQWPLCVDKDNGV